MKNGIIIKDLLEKKDRVDLKLKLVAGEAGISKPITVRDINRPGLAMAGYYDFFAYDRLQLFGLGETAYLRRLSDEERQDCYNKFFSYDINCCIFSHNEQPDRLFIEAANSKNVPVMVTERDTTRFSGILNFILDEVFAPTVSIHGTLVDVNGIGVLLLGKSGVGKSECALELIERGHRLIGDDVI